MLRILRKWPVQCRLVFNQPLVQFYCKQSVISDLLGEQQQWQSLKTYYQKSNRHQMYRKDSKCVYQFDDETRHITIGKFPKLQQIIEWDHVETYNNNELIHAFESLLNYTIAQNISLTDNQFDQFIDHFCNRLQNFTLNDLIRAFQVFAKYPMDKKTIRQRNYIELFHAMDQACTIQSIDLLPEQLLFISSIWMEMPCAKRTQFSSLIKRLFDRYMKSMNAPQLAQTLLYMNEMKLQIDDIRAFENIFDKIIVDMTPQEFVTVLWTFIRIDEKIEKPELRNKYFDYLEKNDINQLNDSEMGKVLFVSILSF